MISLKNKWLIASITVFLLFFCFKFVSAETISGANVWRWFTGNFIQPVNNAVVSSTAYSLNGDVISSWSTGGASAFSDLTDVTLTSTSTGDVLYFNGTDWVNLAIGASGKVLKVNGGVPYWGVDSTGGGTDGNTIYGDNYYYLNTTTIPFVIGADATSTNDNLQVVGSAYVSATSTVLGRLGVGTTNPMAKLLVVGNGVTPTDFTSFTPTEQQRSQAIVVEGDGSAWVAARDNTNGTEAGFGVSVNAGSPVFAGSLNNHNFELRASNTPRMIITPAGYIGIGVSNPAYQLEVSGTVSSTNIITKNSTFTSATSTNLSVSNSFNFLGTVINNVSTWFNGLADLWLSGKSTSNLSEGSNLYYTDARAGSYITSSTTLQTSLSNGNTAYGWGNHALAGYLTNLLGGLNGVFDRTTTTNSTSTNLAVTGSFNFLGTSITNVSTWFFGLANAWLSGKSTSNLTEGTNLYYTDTRVMSYINSSTTLQTVFSNANTAYGWGNHSLAGYLTNLLGGLNGIFGNTTTTNATTTNFNVSRMNTATLDDYGLRLYATSSIASVLGSASTTFNKTWSQGAAINGIKCLTSSGTVGVELGNGTTWTYIEASTTANKITVSYNFADGDAVIWRVKSLTGSATSTNCKVFGTQISY